VWERNHMESGMSKERKSLDDQNIALFSLCVRAREPYCFLCRAPSNHAHHLVPREWKKTRYDPNFGRGICGACHSDEHSLGREKFLAKVRSVIGEAEYDAMQTRYKVPWKWSIAELKEIRRGLRRELEILERNWGRPFDPSDIPF